MNPESLEEFIEDDENVGLLLESLAKLDFNMIKNSLKNEADVNVKQTFGGI